MSLVIDRVRDLVAPGHSFPWRVGGMPDPWCEIVVVDDAESWLMFETWLGERAARGEPLGLDAEINARDPWRPGFACRMVQVADPWTTWVIPVTGTEVALGLARVIRWYPQWVAHFSEADTRFVGRGLPPHWDGLGFRDCVRWEDDEPHFVDTQGLLALYDPRTVTTTSKKDRIHPRIPRLKGLKETVERELTPGLIQAEGILHDRFRELAPKGYRVGQKMLSWGFANIDVRDPAYVIYGALDALCGIRLYWLCRAALERRGLWATSLHEQRVQWMCDRMTYRGMKVDPPYARWLDRQLEGVLEANAPELARYGVPPSAMGPAIGVAMQVLREPVRRTNRHDDGTETPSWDKHALEQVIEDGGPGAPLAELLRLTRKSSKFRSVQVEPMLRTVAECDGMMHCGMRGNGTVSSRMSAQATYTAGALHQLPKRDTRVRAAIEAERGTVLVSCDLSQGEPFTMWALSGDDQFGADLTQPVPILGKPDFNSVGALLVYGDAYDPRSGKVAGTDHYAMRQAFKFAFLACCYGASFRKVASLLGLPVEEGERIRSDWHGRWPRLWALSDELNGLGAVTLDTGHVVPLWDRWYVTELGELVPRTDSLGRPMRSRLGLNGATQGTQAQLLKWAMHRVAAEGWAWALRMALHDELVGQVPLWMAEAFRACLERCMTLTYRGVVLRCEATIEGRTWLPQVGYLSTEEIMSADA